MIKDWTEYDLKSTLTLSFLGAAVTILDLDR